MSSPSSGSPQQPSININPQDVNERISHEINVPLPQVDPVLMEHALAHFYYIKLYDEPPVVDMHTGKQLVPNQKRTTSYKTFYRKKITYADWHRTLKQMTYNPDPEQRDKTPYKDLAEHFLGMSSQEYNLVVQQNELHQIIDALIIRTKKGLPYLSVNIRNLLFKGQGTLAYDEDDAYKFYILAKSFGIKPSDVQSDMVYQEDLSGLLSLEEILTEAQQARGALKDRIIKEMIQEARAKQDAYLAGKAGAIDPLPPLDDNDNKEKKSPG